MPPHCGPTQKGLMSPHLVPSQRGLKPPHLVSGQKSLMMPAQLLSDQKGPTIIYDNLCNYIPEGPNKLITSDQNKSDTTSTCIRPKGSNAISP